MQYDEESAIKFLGSKGYKAVKFGQYNALTKNYNYFLHETEGRKVLHRNHFYYIAEMRERISGAFSVGFRCNKCRYKGDAGSMFGVCAVCTKVQNILKSM